MWLDRYHRSLSRPGRKVGSPTATQVWGPFSALIIHGAQSSKCLFGSGKQMGCFKESEILLRPSRGPHRIVNGGISGIWHKGLRGSLLPDLGTASWRRGAMTS